MAQFSMAQVVGSRAWHEKENWDTFPELAIFSGKRKREILAERFNEWCIRKHGGRVVVYSEPDGSLGCAMFVWLDHVHINVTHLRRRLGTANPDERLKTQVQLNYYENLLREYANNNNIKKTVLSNDI